PTTCSDNNDCNGIEVCDPATGGCVTGPALDCEATEYDGCAGPQACQAPGTCVSQGNPACPAEPDECGGSGGVDWPETGTFSDSVAEAFVLKDEGQWEEKAALVDAIVAHSSTTLTTMESILFNNLNRTGEQITVPGVDCFKYGFYWNDGDNKVDYWWPQGVSNSGVGYGDTTKGEDGKVLGRDVLLVAWYHKAEEDSSTSTYKGVRISIVDVSYINEFKYRHVILAEPVPGDDPAHPDLVPIASASSSVHAGGIAWYGDYLYVADTSKGLRVFDLTKMFQVQTGKKGSLGYVASSDEYHGYNYRYVLPQVGRYKKCSQTCCARFSWVSVDPTTDPPSLLAGEYTDANVKGRAHRWDLDPETSRLALSQGVSRASAVYFPGVKRMQGAVTIDGALFVSSSQPKTSLPVSAGTLYHADGLGEEMEDHQYPTLPEDLSYNPFWDDIRTCTEKPQ
ncbi:MAG: hypothetical protein VX938_00230, partial [Myxococcota bacterium]|nr:hypothetical protein [Myxococcota bacterium]